MPTATPVAPRSAETTELERRVLAHERILQSLIAYMSQAEPRFLIHLRERFVDSMKMVRHEHDFRDVDDCAEEFIRAVMLIGEKSIPNAPNAGESAMPTRAAEPSSARASRPFVRPERVKSHERNGIWEVTVDGAFSGHYRQKEHALAAMALAKLSLNET